MAASSQQPFEVTDFSQGITDDVFEQVYNAAEEIDNFILTSDAKLESRNGSDLDNYVDEQIPAGAKRIAGLLNYANNTALLVHADQQFFYRNPDNYTTIQGPTGNDVLSAGDTSNAISMTQWNKHVLVTSDAFPVPMKIYQDELGVFQVRNNGLPYLAADPIITAGVAGVNKYLYAFHYHYTYMAGDQQFDDEGPITFVELNGSGDPQSNPNNISGIPVLTNGLIDNWDTLNIKVYIYRTVDSGETFYKIGQVTNGTTTFVDNVSDAYAQENGLVLYTDDGTVDFEPAPKSKFVHVVNGTAYYGYIKEGSQEFKYRVVQGIPGVQGAVSADFYSDLEDEIVGLGSTKSIPLVFCRKHVYRIEQGFDQFGRGQMVPIRISDTAGCISGLSITQAENFCLWWGQDGIYSTDGYQVIKISDSLNSRYTSILENQSNLSHIYGKFNEKDRRVYWAMQRDSGNLDNDSLVILDLRWGIRPKSTFTTWSGKSFRPTALEFFNGFLYRGDSRGYVFKHSAEYSTDPKVDPYKAASEWATETIIWSYASTNINFGSTFFRKMPTKVLLTASNLGNTSIQISAISDEGRIVRELKPIRWRRNFIWGDEEFLWGNPDCVWRGVGLIEQWRRFPARALRLSYLQLIITNAFVVVTSSTIDGTATFDNIAKTVDLDVVVDNSWGNDVVGYYIKTAADNYQEQYEVIERVSDTQLVVIDAENTLPTGSYAWELWGYRKGEQLKLLSYNIHWNNVSQTQNTFESGQDGTNA